MNKEIINKLGVTDTRISIFTDGSFKFNHNKTQIGYGFTVFDNNKIISVSNGKLNIGKSKYKLGALYAETIAIEKAINWIIKKNINNVTIFTDSLFLYRAIYENNRLNPVLQAFLNKLSIALDRLLYRDLHIDIQYVKGHNNIIGNELADYLARNGRKKKKVDIFQLLKS